MKQLNLVNSFNSITNLTVKRVKKDQFDVHAIRNKDAANHINLRNISLS